MLLQYLLNLVLITGDGASYSSHAAVAPAQDLGRHLAAVPDDLLVADHVRPLRAVQHLRTRNREAQNDACEGENNQSCTEVTK